MIFLYIGKGSWLIDIHRKIPYNTFYESPFLQDITIYLFRNLGFKSVLYCTAICSYWRVYLLYSISSSKAVNPFDLYKGILNCAPCCCWRGFAPNMRYCAELWPGTRPGHINYNLEDRGHQTCQRCFTMFSRMETTIDNTTILMEVSSFLKAEVADSFLKGLSINDVTQKIIQSF